MVLSQIIYYRFVKNEQFVIHFLSAACFFFLNILPCKRNFEMLMLFVTSNKEMKPKLLFCFNCHLFLKILRFRKLRQDKIYFPSGGDLVHHNKPSDLMLSQTLGYTTCCNGFMCFASFHNR